MFGRLKQIHTESGNNPLTIGKKICDVASGSGMC